VTKFSDFVFVLEKQGVLTPLYGKKFLTELFTQEIKEHPVPD
jgi:hypothetical protein